jgi:hypothetical protein
MTDKKRIACGAILCCLLPTHCIAEARTAADESVELT